MIKIFRKIRQQLLTQNRFTRYILYAVGEIVLVMIGILLALQVNKWNNNIELKQNELIFLDKLKDEINNNVKNIMRLDSLTGTYIKSFEEPFNNYYKIKTVEDLLELGEKFKSQWHPLRFTTTIYDEMVNTGRMYTLQNKVLQNQISEYYDYAKDNKGFIETINKTAAELLFINDKMFPVSYLVENYNKDWFNKRTIDTSWINNPNSPTYLAIYRFFYFSIESDKDRQDIYNATKEKGLDLIAKIEKELEQGQK